MSTTENEPADEGGVWQINEDPPQPEPDDEKTDEGEVWEINDD